MHRKPVLALIDCYEQSHPLEAETVGRLKQFVLTHEDCFERTQKSGHITGSAWILDTTSTRVLLTHHRKLDIWVQLGGHADGDTDVRAVALKEAEEESGLTGFRFLQDGIFDIDIHAIPARGDEPEHFHYDCRFLLQATADDYTVSAESHDLEWIALSEIAQYTTEESVLRMVRKTPGSA